MEFKKNDIRETEITDLTVEGMGVGKADGFTFFVSAAVPGDVIKMRIVKLKKSYGYGIIEEIIKPSPNRTEPPCPIFKKCGGCSLQHISYSAQLDFKHSTVKNSLTRIGGLPSDICVNAPVGAESPFRYRNKGQYPIGTIDGKAVAGFYAPRSHKIIPLTDCLINQPSDSKILKTITDFMNANSVTSYDEETGRGVVRHVLIRTAAKTGEIMVCIVINADDLPGREALIPLLKAVPGVTTAVLNINKRKTNVILGDKIKPLFGKGYITDCIGELKFKISPLSFFQVNPVQTEKLYKTVLTLAGLKGTETVFDLYCGIGTISLFLAGKAREVYGIEIVPDAIADANENAAANNIKNAHFYTGAAEDLCSKLQAPKPDLIVIDPPRKGCAPELLETLKAFAPPKIIYVSCNPSTLARDLACLKPLYTPTQITPVDMFPLTNHIETVVLLSQQKPDDYIEVDLDLDELDATSAEAKATYQEIKDYVLKEHNLKVSSLYISQVKRKSGLPVGQSYNHSKYDDYPIPNCPPDKEEAIREALKHFQML
ncbi:MAG: 23S rRNA (uracil(1939)-C(5))-methyltransferase RlmD [Clostridiales bacterium]|nr:23S rRNA (uracil(1939)-C(5))-methyltransferase RlmD [Clostridiales bacterium]